jgi:hypothetical protein
VTSGARLVAAVLVMAIVVTGAWAFTRGSEDEPERARAASADGPSELAVLSITGTPNPLLAVVGVHEDRPPAAVVLPPGVTVVAPGQGETTTDGVAALPAGSMRVAVSNAIGTWVDHYGTIAMLDLVRSLDDQGGLAVELAEPASLDGAQIPAGEATLTGAQVEAYLSEAGEVAPIRWAEVVDGLLAADALDPTLVESDDPEAFVEMLGRAAGAVVEIAPVAPVADAASVLDQPAAGDLLRSLFGARAATPIVIQNGNGEPNVGEAVAELLLPAGFRVVLSQNADTFRYRQTEIAATAEGSLGEAERVRELLGVGRVVVSQVPSGLADITIVVGRDFTA